MHGKTMLIGGLVVLMVLMAVMGGAVQARPGAPPIPGGVTLIGAATPTPTLEPFPTPPWLTPVVGRKP